MPPDNATPPPPVVIVQTPSHWNKFVRLAGFIVIAVGVWHIWMTIAGAAGWLKNPITWPGSDKPGAIIDAGPQVTQLERMQQLVSSRVHVSDILIGESTWLQGSWLVHGDALLSVDVRHAQIVGRDDAAKRATIILPSPTVISPRVNHEKTREWNVTARSWYAPKLLFGNEDALRNVAMQKAQELIEMAAGDAELIADAKQKAADFVREFYSQIGWNISVQWD